jgi:hypothetical protein
LPLGDALFQVFGCGLLDQLKRTALGKDSHGVGVEEHAFAEV